MHTTKQTYKNAYKICGKKNMWKLCGTIVSNYTSASGF